MNAVGCAKLIEGVIEQAFRKARKGRNTRSAKLFMESKMVGLWCSVMDYDQEKLISEINKYE